MFNEYLELSVLFMILAFTVIQLGMAVASRLWYPQVKRWKERLQASHSIPARLELIIFR